MCITSHCNQEFERPFQNQGRPPMLGTFGSELCNLAFQNSWNKLISSCRLPFLVTVYLYETRVLCRMALNSYIGEKFFRSCLVISKVSKPPRELCTRGVFEKRPVLSIVYYLFAVITSYNDGLCEVIVRKWSFDRINNYRGPYLLGHCFPGLSSKPSFFT